MTEELRDVIMVILDDVIKLREIVSSASIQVTDPADTSKDDTNK